MTTRTRFAPSPTGNLHIGNARTALFNWLYAKKTGGDFILRIEDTDTERSKAAFEKGIYEDLKWLGLGWDEGPDIGGDKGPYRQSERLAIYKKYAEKLLSEGLAYNCYCSKERLEELKKKQTSMNVPPRYDGRCRTINKNEVPVGAAPVIRFRVPEKAVSFRDGVHGHLEFDSRIFGDFVIIGSDAVASYNFAVVIDDALMGITDIIRGDDHLSNTPRQILLFESLGFKTPKFSHIPLVLGADRTPLGKRQERASLKSLRAAGYLPKALINTIARLGWSPGDEFLSLDGLGERFSVEKLSNSPSVFDTEKLAYYNKLAISGSSATELIGLLGDNFKGIDGKVLTEYVEAVKHNAATLGDIKKLLVPFTGEPDYTEEALGILKEPYAKKVLNVLHEEASRIDETPYDELMGTLKEKTGEKGKKLFMPVRAALTGDIEGIELPKIFRLLGRERILSRLEKFI